MNREKIRKVVTIFCESLDINNQRYANIICELMENIIEKYRKCGISEIEDDQKYLIKGNNNKYSVEDFFLNRLLFNVTSFELKDTGTRGCYIDYGKSIELNRTKLSTLLDKYPAGAFTEKQKYDAAKKVVMHEFEHALQTRFDIGPDLNSAEHFKSLYKILSQSNLDIILNEFYDGRKIFPNFGSGRRLQSGLMGDAVDDKYKKYAGADYFGHNYSSEYNINEIFNESEALVLSGSNQNFPVKFKSGNTINVRNIESSNYLITNYAFMLKLLLGEQRTFEGMYLDRNVIIDYFNSNFGDIFEKVFGEHLKKKYPNVNIFDGWTILNIAIGEIKYSNEDKAEDYCDICQVKLNYALSLCLEKTIDKKIANGASIDELKQLWWEFANSSLYNNNKQLHDTLPHVQVLNGLKLKVSKLASRDLNIEDNRGKLR